MQRRSFLGRAAAGAAAAAAVAAPAVVHAQATVRWRLASSFPKSLDTIYGAADVFSKQVSAATGGKFTVSVHAAGELVPAFGVVDGIQNGTIEAAHTAPYYFFGKDPTFAMDCAIPFGFNARQMTAWMYEGNGLKLFREFYRNFNIVNFPMGNTGAQMGGWYRKEIKSVADMKGLKMRIGGFGGKVLERLGSVPQNIPGGEIYTALEKGTIDAAEWVGPYDDLKLGFYKVAPWYGYPGWWEGGPQLTLYVNTKAWDALSADYKAIVEAGCLACTRHHAGRVRRQESGGAEDARGQRSQAVPYAEGRDGRCIQGRLRGLCGAEQDQPGLEEGLHGLQPVSARGYALVPLHRVGVRQLHAVAADSVIDTPAGPSLPAAVR